MSRIEDPFWSARIQIVRENTLPSMYQLLKKTGRWDLMKLKIIKGAKPHHFWDSDIAKFLEAVCYSLKYMPHNDPLRGTFLQWINEAVDMIIEAQQPDGYINSYYTVVEPENKLKNITEKHELYCAGHLLEAAIAHFQATGETRLLNALCRYLDLICTLFGPEEGKMHGYPGHQEIEIAIARLLKIRWEERYFRLLEYFIEQRGYNRGEFFDDQARARGIDPETYIPKDPGGAGWWPHAKWYEYYQAISQIRDTKEVQGHSVRQYYYLTAAQRLATLKNDDSLREAINRLWDDTICKKMYIHGGIGAIDLFEGFGEAYDLRWDGYSETCASIALIFCAQAILTERLDANVAYVAERALYNNVLGGVSLDGRAYYYDQPVSGTKGLKRQEWFECSCCPPNVARLFNSLEEYVVYKVDGSLVVNFYIGGTFIVEDSVVKVTTNYPLGGKLTLEFTTPESSQVAVRAPKTAFSCSVDDYELKNGYIFFPKRIWQGEQIAISFDLEMAIIRPDPKVAANKGCLAVEYGPFVYALEASGLASKHPLDTLTLSPVANISKTKACINDCYFWQLDTTLSNVPVQLVPYFVTGNKIPGDDFRIWIQEAKD